VFIIELKLKSKTRIIKPVQKGVFATNRMKQIYLSAKDKSEHSVDVAENSVSEYSADKLEETVSNVSHKSADLLINTGKRNFKTTKKSVKTANRNIKTAKRATKSTKKIGEASQKVVKRTKTGTKTAKGVINSAVSVVKAIISAGKSLLSVIIAGGWVVILIIILICIIGFIAFSVYGIFFSGEETGADSEEGTSMQSVISEINSEYEAELDKHKSEQAYDVLEMNGSRALWKEVLALYAVSVNTGDDSQEVATIDNGKKQRIKKIFWDMHSVSSELEIRTETVITESDDGNGNVVQTQTRVNRKYLIISTTHQSIDEMAEKYGFDDKQREYLNELLKDKNDSMWSTVLYGIGTSDDEIISVALSQLGNVGGQPYWSWYGFNGRVEWCACFVSWCANECGYIDAGIIPKFASCHVGIDWFKERGQWADSTHEPTAGTLIFFDWENDGRADHVGLVEKCENDMVYTVEGNSGDTCTTMKYSVGSKNIYGYGIPSY